MCFAGVRLLTLCTLITDVVFSVISSSEVLKLISCNTGHQLDVNFTVALMDNQDTRIGG